MRMNGKKRALFLVTALLLAVSAPLSAFAEATAALERSETVYVTAFADGKARTILSSVYIVNADGRASIEDAARLTDVKNVLSNEAPTVKNGRLIFNVDGEDVCYQGESNDALPFSMAVTYELDGKQITPEQLAGKSGHVRVTVTYQNNLLHEVAREDGEAPLSLYTPFNIITIISLGEDFSAVQCTNAEIMSEAGTRSVFGLTFPGLAHNLQQEPIDELSESLSFEADVSSFALDSIMAIVMPDILDGSDLERVDDLREMVDGFSELQEAGEKLAYGGSSLSSGAKKLNDGMGDLSDGLSSLSGEIGRAADAAEQAEGNLDLGISAAGGAIDDAISAIDAVQIGSADAAANAVVAGVSVELTDEQKDAVRASAKAVWNQTFGSVNGQLQGAKAQLQALRSNLPAIKSAAQQLISAIGQLDDGVRSLADAGKQIKEGLSELASGASGLRSGIWKFYNEGLTPLVEETESVRFGLARKDAMLALAEAYTSFSGDPETTNGSVRFIVTTDSIYAPSITPEPLSTAEPEPEPGFFVRTWEWIKNLFGG